MAAEASKIAQDISGLHEPQLGWIHIDSPQDWEDDISEHPDDETCLARDLLEVLDNEYMDTDRPASANSDIPAPDAAIPMIERELWISNSNPASKSTP